MSTTAARVLVTLSSTVAADVEVSSGLGIPIIVAKDVTLDGDRVREYAIAGAASAAASDLDSGFIDAITAAMITAFSGAEPRTSKVLVVKQDASGTSETVSDALDAAEALGYRAGREYTIILCSSRVTSDHSSGNDWLEADSSRWALLVIQSDDTDWVTSSLPSGYGAWENVIAIYHDEDADEVDALFSAVPAGRDPERRQVGDQSGRVTWLTGASGTVPAYATALTAAQRAAATANNANYHLPASSSDASRILLTGVCLDGTSSLVSYGEIVAKAVLLDAVAGPWLSLISRGESLDSSIRGRTVIEQWTVEGIETLIAAGWVSPDAAGGLPDGYTVSVTLTSSTSANVDVQLALGDQISSITIPITIRPIGA